MVLEQQMLLWRGDEKREMTERKRETDEKTEAKQQKREAYRARGIYSNLNHELSLSIAIVAFQNATVVELARVPHQKTERERES